MKLKQLMPVLALVVMASNLDAITKKAKTKVQCKNQKVSSVSFNNNTDEDLDITVKFTFVGSNTLGKNNKSIPSPRGKVFLKNLAQGSSDTARAAEAIYMPKKQTNAKKVVIAPLMTKTESICISGVFIKSAGSKYKGQNVWNNKTMSNQTSFEVTKEDKKFQIKPA